MFSQKLYNANAERATEINDPETPHYRMGDYGYGKKEVRVFQLNKTSPVHSISEFLVTSHMRLNRHKEYYNADNSEIIGSDVQETTIYMHAQKYGLRTPEEFALSLSEYFLKTYDLVESSNIIVEELGWSRLGEHATESYYKNRPHNHVFVREANGRRTCEVVRKRGVAQPLLIGGISGFRIIKTAKAPFVGYIKGSLGTEGDMPDRILGMGINAKWEYSRLDNIDFNTHWFKVRDLILQQCAGDSEEGVITTSVQCASYRAERAVLDAIPEIRSISIDLINYKYMPFDFSKFPPMGDKANVIISNPSDAPCGVGYARLDRIDGIDNSKL